MFERLRAMEERYLEINELLGSDEYINDFNKARHLLQEQKKMEQAVMLYRQYKELLTALEETKKALGDPELKALAQEEITSLKVDIDTLISTLEMELLPKDPNDDKNVILEIRGAAGGDEANIFAGDLFRAYAKFASSEGLQVEILNENEAAAGGFSLIEALITGPSAYAKFKYESGAHRVQRIPVTETQGRVHTSTATVLAMPEAEEIDIDINENDIKVDTFRSGGAGGQSVNTTDSAVRLTHVPTGIVVTCQKERSQIKNKEQALKILRARIFDKINSDAEKASGSERKSKIGSGDRSEKIRTYNYPQNRVTDHRINFTTRNLDQVMEGDFNDIIVALINEEQRRLLSQSDEN